MPQLEGPSWRRLGCLHYAAFSTPACASGLLTGSGRGGAVSGESQRACGGLCKALRTVEKNKTNPMVANGQMARNEYTFDAGFTNCAITKPRKILSTMMPAVTSLLTCHLLRFLLADSYGSKPQWLAGAPCWEHSLSALTHIRPYPVFSTHKNQPGFALPPTALAATSTPKPGLPAVMYGFGRLCLVESCWQQNIVAATLDAVLFSPRSRIGLEGCSGTGVLSKKYRPRPTEVGRGRSEYFGRPTSESRTPNFAEDLVPLLSS